MIFLVRLTRSSFSRDVCVIVSVLTTLWGYGINPPLPTQWGYGSKSQGSHSSSVRHRVVVILASVGAQHAAPHVRTIDPPEGAVIPARKTNGYRAFWAGCPPPKGTTKLTIGHFEATTRSSGCHKRFLLT